MRIVVLGTRGFPNVQGGIEVHCENLYAHLVKKGCEVIVFTRRPYIDSGRTFYKGIRLVPLACLKNKFLETFSHTLIGLFVAKKFSPDILHIHGIGPSLIVPIARILGLRVIVTNHGPDYKRKKWTTLAKFVLSLGEYLGTRYANSVICVSKSYAKRIRNKYHRRDVAAIPNGAALAQIIHGNGMLKKHKLSKGKYVLSVGRFVPEKGFHDLIEAFEDNHRGYKLVIVGDADHSDKYVLDLKEKAARNSNIVLTGILTREALYQLYSQAALFVLPSYYECLPIVLLEAMNYGLSCIGSDISASRDIGLSKDRLFKPGDTQALNKKIKEFLNKPLTYKEKEKQKVIIKTRYDWQSIADKTFSVYKQVTVANF